MSRNRRWYSLLVIAMVVLLAACGQSGENNNSAKQAGEANKQGANSGNQSAPEADQPIKIQTAKGEVELKEPAKRIVTIEWTYTEDLLALGVQPVGHADIEGYNAYVNVPVKLDASVTDVGTRQEPNLDIIASLKPDLIITDAFRAEKNYDQLVAIAPVIAFNSYPAEGGNDQFSEMEQSFRAIAAAVGKTDEAEKVLTHMNETFAKAKEKLAAAGKEGSEIVLTQAWSANDVPSLRLFTDNSAAIQIMNKIGLKNAWKSDKFELYGFSTATVEALAQVQNASLLHIVQDNDNVFENQLKDNPVWTGLNFVKENRVYALGGDSWPFGGPLSAELFAEKTADLLSK